MTGAASRPRRAPRGAWLRVMRVLVTGAAGFIGSHILDSARGLGHEVRGYDSLTPAVHDGRPGYLPDDVELVVADVRDAAAVRRALAGVDVVCHQAALVGLGVDLADLPAYSDVNVTGTATLLAEMGRAGVGRLVLASSMVVYGEGAYDCAPHGQDLQTATISEDAPLDPRNAYATSKLAQEHLAASWARLTDGRAVALRYH